LPQTFEKPGKSEKVKGIEISGKLGKIRRKCKQVCNVEICS